MKVYTILELGSHRRWDGKLNFLVTVEMLAIIMMWQYCVYGKYVPPALRALADRMFLNPETWWDIIASFVMWLFFPILTVLWWHNKRKLYTCAKCGHSWIDWKSDVIYRTWTGK